MVDKKRDFCHNRVFHRVNFLELLLEIGLIPAHVFCLGSIAPSANRNDEQRASRPWTTPCLG
jgi:hypothetical protein